ncbi:hypothetical protein SAMN02745206_02922 [Desulfacinum infernum DSM 9756]|uniref:Uncharacterized protein n=1 Tax=Desulfacinum infernum DSM 9756 TaxID=1121391 RepID=A0A1M5FM90_9BACT|nr:hypothetical protein SAMN02745206_02922 [Desulfacinum infernum DSM 9756]
MSPFFPLFSGGLKWTSLVPMRSRAGGGGPREAGGSGWVAEPPFLVWALQNNLYQTHLSC